jgi:hypothetical protein
MYDKLEKRKRKIPQMKEEIFKLSKNNKKILFNVFNISNKDEFIKKMDKDFGYLEYEVVEEDKEENCLVVSVDKTIADDFLYIDGCQIGNNNVDLYLDEEQNKKKSNNKRKTSQKMGTWDDAPVKKTPKKDDTKKTKVKTTQPEKKRGRLQK